MIGDWYSPGDLPRIKSSLGQWLDKLTKLHDKSCKKAGMFIQSQYAAVSRTYSLCTTLLHTSHSAWGLFKEAKLGSGLQGLIYVSLFVFTSAALTQPWSPGTTRVTGPKGQRLGREFSSTVPRNGARVRTSSSPPYIGSRHFHMWLVITWACLHLFPLPRSHSVTISIGKLLYV